MNSAKITLLLVVLLAVAGTVAGQARKGGKGRPPQPVMVSTVQLVSELPSFQGNGLLTPLAKAMLSVDFAGRVTAVKKRAGDIVKEGEVLAVLANKDLELDLLVLQARLAEVQAERALSQQKQTRMKRLFEQKLATAEQFENENASAAVSEARVASVRSQVSRLKTQLGLMRVRAPFAGQVVKVDLEIGQWVTPNKPIFEIYNYDHLELLVGAPGRFLNQISPGVPVTISIPEIGKTLAGRIEAVVNHVEPGSGNFLLRIEAKNPGSAAISGLLASVEVPVGRPGKSKTVPRDSIVRKQGKTLVVVVRDGKAALVPVRIEGNLGEGSLIVAGALEPGEEVVVRGNERLGQGAAVRVMGKP